MAVYVWGTGCGATSGTTGPAKRVIYTDADTAHTVGLFTAGISEMLSAGEKCFIAFPFTGPFGLGDLIAKAVEALGGSLFGRGLARPGAKCWICWRKPSRKPISAFR